MVKVTKREMFDRIFAILTDIGNTEEAEFVAKQITLLDRKKNATRAMTKTQLENVEIKNDIVAVLENTGEAMRAGDIAKVLDINVQKATALLKQLVDAKRVVRETDGKVTMFKVTE